MNPWQDILYDAKKDFYQRSVISPEHIKLKKALEKVEQEIKPISQELEEKRKENESLKAQLADSLTQLRLFQYEKDKEIDRIKNEFGLIITERLKEKEIIANTYAEEHKVRIMQLQQALETIQTRTAHIESQKNALEYSTIDKMQKLTDQERLERTLTLRRKDDDIQALQDRLIQKEDELKTMSATIHAQDEQYLLSQKQWMHEIQFSREVLKKSIEEMDAVQKEYMNRENEIIADLQHQIYESKKHIAQLEKDVPDQKITLMEIQLKEKDELLRRTADHNKELRDTLEHMQQTSLEYAHPIEQLLQEKEALNKHIDALEQTHQTLVSEAQQLRTQLEEAEHASSNYKQKLDQLPSDFDIPSLIEQSHAYVSLKDEKSVLKKSFASEKEHLNKDIKEREAVITQLKNQVSILEEKLRTAYPIPSEAISEATAGPFQFIPDIPKVSLSAESKSQEEEGILPWWKKMIAPLLSVSKQMRLGIAVTAIFVCIGVAAWYFLKPFLLKPRIHTIDLSYKAPDNNPSALIWDGLAFWSTDWFSKKIFKHKSHSLHEYAEVVTLNSIIPGAITWAQGDLWVTDAWSKKIQRLSPENNFAIVSSYDSPASHPAGLAWDGTYMWSCDTNTKMIYAHAIESNFHIVKSYPAPGNAPSGLLWDGDALWSADRDTNMIYRHSLDDALSVLSSYLPKDYQDNKDTLVGLTWDGKYFWTVGEKSGRFYRHSIHDMIKQ